MRALFSEDDGFSLIELLVTIVVGGVVLSAALLFFLSVLSSSAKVTDRSDAASRARLGVDRATTLLQAQVCNGTGTDATVVPIQQATATSVRFTANLGNATAPPVGYELKFDNVNHVLTEDRYVFTASPDASGYRSWPAVTDSSTVVENVYPESGTSPVFTYYAISDTTTGAQSAPLAFDATGSLTNALKATVMRVDINLRVLSTSIKSRSNDPTSALLRGTAYVGSNLKSDELDKGPRC